MKNNLSINIFILGYAVYVDINFFHNFFYHSKIFCGIYIDL